MAEALTLTGKFLGAGAVKTIGQNQTKIRPFWLDITDNIEFPNTPEFQLKNDKVYLVDNLQKGQTIQIRFYLNGRKYEKEGRKGVITNLDVVKIDVMQYQSAAAPVATQPTRQQQSVPATQPTRQAVPTTPFGDVAGDDDLPF